MHSLLIDKFYESLFRRRVKYRVGYFVSATHDKRIHYGYAWESLFPDYYRQFWQYPQQPGRLSALCYFICVIPYSSKPIPVDWNGTFNRNQVFRVSKWFLKQVP